MRRGACLFVCGCVKITSVAWLDMTILLPRSMQFSSCSRTSLQATGSFKPYVCVLCKGREDGMIVSTGEYLVSICDVPFLSSIVTVSLAHFMRNL